MFRLTHLQPTGESTGTPLSVRWDRSSGDVEDRTSFDLLSLSESTQRGRLFALLQYKHDGDVPPVNPKKLPRHDKGLGDCTYLFDHHLMRLR